MTHTYSTAAPARQRVGAAAVKQSGRKPDAAIIAHQARPVQLTPRYSTQDLTAEEQRIFFRDLMESNECL